MSASSPTTASTTPPAFITLFSLDNEARTYDDKGRIAEIGYGMGFTELRMADPVKLFVGLG